MTPARDSRLSSSRRSLSSPSCSRAPWIGTQDARGALSGQGRNVLSVEIAESYAARALECAESTARELAGAQALDVGEVDLLVATASVPGFADALAARLGVSGERVAPSPDFSPRAYGRPHAGTRNRASRAGRAPRCSSRPVRGSRSRPRSTGGDRTDPRRAPAQARCQPAGAARTAEAARPDRAGATARAGAAGPDPGRDRGARHRHRPRRTSSRRSADTRACSAPGCATRRT